MGIIKVSGTRVPVNDLEAIRESVDPPCLLVYHPARVLWKALALQLAGVTALTGQSTIDAVQEAASALEENENANWTQSDALRILAAAGSIPTPSHVTVNRLTGEGILLFRAVTPEMPGARKLVYSKGSRRPQLSILAALRSEGIRIPEGTALEVPVKLVQEEDGLSLAAYFRRGTPRDLSQAANSGASGQGSAAKK